MNPTDPMPYTVYFENLPTASAYARRVTVSDPIDTNLDIRSFRLSQIVFNNRTIEIPANRSYYQTRVAMTDQGTNIVVDISAGVDLTQRRVFWTFNAIDLNTGEAPLSVNQGVLPPDATNQIGQGYVVYSLKPAAGVATGTVITNSATIVFDDNEPINTRVVQNIMDAIPPSSYVVPLPTNTLSASFDVSWYGADETNGSGLQNFDIYFTDNGGDQILWQSGTTNYTSTFINAKPGHTYAFYSRARDNANNLEPAHTNADTRILVSGNTPPVVGNIADQVVTVNSDVCFTNAITDAEGNSFTASLLNAPGGAAAQVVNGTNLVICISPTLREGGSTNLLQVVITDNGVPSLSTTQTVLLTVPDFVKVDLGSTTVNAGESGCVPITLASSASVTNVQFLVNVPAGSVASASVSPGVAAVCSGTAQSLSPTQLLVGLQMCAGQSLSVTQQQVATLCLTVTNQSGTVPLNLAQVTAIKSNGVAVAGTVGTSGTLSVVATNTPPPPPTVWLEARYTNGVRALILHGVPGDAYALEYRTSMSSGSWTRLPYQVTMTTNAAMQVQGVQPEPAVVFYRAVKVVPFSGPARLEILLNTNGVPYLNVYGPPGYTYLLQYTRSMNSPNWNTISRLTITNSPTYMPTLNPLGNKAYFRLAPVDPPQVDVSVNPDSSREFLVYGLPGSTYVLQYTASLSDTNWLTLKTITLSNATSMEFQMPSGGAAAYRVVKLDLSVAPFWLQAMLMPDGSRNLALYGAAGMTYALEYTTQLGTSNTWTRLPSRFGLTNSPMMISGIPSGTIYYRAVQSVTEPSQVQVAFNSDGSQQLTLYGQPNTTYSIQYATSLNGTWTELKKVSFLENAFMSMRITSPAPGGTVFYKVVKL